MTLILHRGGEAIDLSALKAVPAPQATDTHVPLPHSVVGVASLLFALLCPEEIRRNPTRMQFVSSTDVTENRVIATSQFQRVLSLYMERHEGEGEIQKGKEIEYPIALEMEFETLIGEMFRHVEGYDDGDDDHPISDQLYAGPAAYPNIHGIARIVWSNPKVAWSFTQPFRALAPEFARDVGFILYGTLDYQRFPQRLLIGVLYAIGLILVAVPTVTTFLRVTWAMLSV
jgi:hypothetical protein